MVVSSGRAISTTSPDDSPSVAVQREDVSAAAGAFAGTDTVVAELGGAFICVMRFDEMLRLREFRCYFLMFISSTAFFGTYDL